MAIDAVTISINYDDYLYPFMIYNRRLFDRLAVVTLPEDKKTIDLCRKFDAEPVFSHRVTGQGDPFNRGKGVNDGIAALQPKDWLCIIDADILLTETRAELEWKLTYQHILYSAPRTFLATPDDFRRWVKGEQKLWTTSFREFCYGYLQIAHASNAKTRFEGGPNWYYEGAPQANGSDVQFRERWNEPDWFTLVKPCVHLGPAYVNWAGRKSEPFCPAWEIDSLMPLIEAQIQGFEE